jgi:hypothetical protein
MDIARALKRKALESNKNFLNDVNICKGRSEFKPPPPQPGFKLIYEKRMPYNIHTEHDPRGVMSLALVNKKSEILKLYSDKLTMLTINVARYFYTLEAFALRNNQSDETFPICTQALTFYVETDLRYCTPEYITRKRAQKNHIPAKVLQEDHTIYDKLDEIQPNENFSEILHKLRSNGYLEYIFELALETRLNVDLIYNNTIIARYLLEDGTDRDPAIGFITVRHHADQWYVKTTKEPLFVVQSALNITSIKELKSRPRERYKYIDDRDVL